MTLDPVHVAEIASLASLIDADLDADEHREFAARVWADHLDPLWVEDRRVVEPIGEQRRRIVPVDDVALSEAPFEIVHGVDAGTLNPTTYRNGCVVDVAHAAMAREPSDPELHRRRTIVAAIHLHDSTRELGSDWRPFDDGYGRRKWLDVPAVDRFVEGVVHTCALYHAELEHAHWVLEDVEDLLVLDGPIYPNELLRWEDRHPALSSVLSSHPLPAAILDRSVELLASCLDRNVPIVGFVKNPTSNRVTRAVRAAGHPAPWFNDAGLFRHVLDPSEHVDRPNRHLACSNWFVSRAGTDAVFAADGDRLIRPTLPAPAARFETAFMMILDPRDGIVYRAEAPRGVVDDADVRRRITRYLLRAVAAERGPPRAIGKADRLAGIGRREKASLRRLFEARWSTTVDMTYDDLRWGFE